MIFIPGTGGYVTQSLKIDGVDVAYHYRHRSGYDAGFTIWHTNAKKGQVITMNETYANNGGAQGKIILYAYN